MQILPNPTVIALQVVPFLLTLIGLYQLVFKPTLQHLAGREDAIDGARHRAADLARQLADRTAELEGRLQGAKAEIAELRAQRRAVAISRAAEIVQAARAAVEAESEQALARVSQESAAARAGLRAASESIADSVAARVLGRPLAQG